MGSVPVATEPCPVCQAKPKYSVGRVCTKCYSKVNAYLNELPELASHAAYKVQLQAVRQSAGRFIPSSRPPLNLDAIDPALALIELAQGDKSSSVTILEALESWERVVRSERGLVPYGVASSQNRDPLSSTAVLRNVCRFLTVWLEWMAEDDQIDFGDFAFHVESSRRVLARWSLDVDRAPRWRVSCPTVGEDGDQCEASLSFVGLEDGAVTCRRCGSSWTPARLLVVATASDGESVWVDAEAAGVAVGVDPSTIRRWARTGRVRRQGQRYSLSDIRGVVGGGVSGV